MNERRKRDAYDDEVKYLTEHPEKIREFWTNSTSLFGFVTASRGMEELGDGCLTMIRLSGNEIPTRVDGLADEIRADERIPSAVQKITVSSLPVFAEWQRRIDKELGRTPPERMVSA